MQVWKELMLLCFNPFVCAAAGTVYSTWDCTHKRVNKTVSQVIIVKESKLYADWIKVAKLLLCLGSILFTTVDNRHTGVVLVTFYHSPFLHV